MAFLNSWCCCPEPRTPAQLIHSHSSAPTGRASLPALLIRSSSLESGVKKHPTRASPPLEELPELEPPPGSLEVYNLYVEATRKLAELQAQPSPRRSRSVDEPEAESQELHPSASSASLAMDTPLQQARPPLRRDQTYVIDADLPELRRPHGWRLDQTYVSDAAFVQTAEQQVNRAKKRLSTSTSHFGSKAAQGCQCIYLDPATGKKSKATYRLDKAFENFVVESAQSRLSLFPFAVKFPVSAIENITEMADFEGSSPGSHAATANLTNDEVERLAMITYKGGRGQVHTLFLLEESHHSRDFLCKGLMRLKTASAPQVS